MAGRLEGRTAVVTGASSGHGRAIALALAGEGAAIVVADLNKSARPGGFEPEAEIDTDDIIVRDGGRAVFVQANVTSEADMHAAAQRAVSEFGRLDIWVNNAGTFTGAASVVDESLEAWNTTLAVNLTGTWLGCKAAVTVMRDQERLGRGKGRIINMGSIAGEVGQPNLASYSTTKGGIHELTRTLAVECAPWFINVNALAPGYFPTAMNRATWDDPEALQHVQDIHPWPELATSADVGSAVVFLASEDAAWITGAVVPVDGGFLAT
jgi:NAD(P)-dependent dehydrogenase (short-subunit alcohol dehydrogenase family)